MSRNVRYANLCYIACNCVVAVIIRQIGFLAEAVPLRSENALSADGIKAPTQPPDSGKQVYEAKPGGSLGLVVDKGFQTLDGGFSWRRIAIFPAINCPKCVSGPFSSFLWS